jgi:hypothetical protein
MAPFRRFRATLLGCALAGCASESGADGDGSGAGSSSSSGSDTTGIVPLEVDAEVVTYPEQPMVADLVLRPSIAAEAIVSHVEDAGVRVTELDDGDDATLTYRVRGLAPDTAHQLRYQLQPSVVDPNVGAGIVGEIDFTTPAPLPGFLAGFQLETTAIAPEPVYRMFDFAGFPTGPATGLFVVDTAGITRFYLGIDNELAGPAMVWAAVKLLDDGTLLFVRNETLYQVTELGEILLELPAADMDLPSLHHEILLLPNGNYMALSLAFEDHTYPGRLGDQHVAGDLIVEFTREGEVVWTWNSFDHLDPLRLREDIDAPPYIDPATGEESLDWTHGNGLIYESGDDTVILSLRHQDWILRIDRATGEIVWRLGDEGDFTLAEGSRWFFHPHSPEWQSDGTLLLYDNAIGDPNPPAEGSRSRAVRFELDQTAMTAAVVWEDDEEPFLAPIAGDADRMPNDHILVLDSSITDDNLTSLYSRLRELDETASPMRVWSIVTPTNTFAYRATAHERLPGMSK